ncbi:MAG: hypothetical protein CMF13_02205 [Idiomarina sp.]|nr:hypothetical protein [Idiomarina sp.]|tara:strand:+ start:636 stop:968 length:333 start_codon:yes stop_codon:yes gene_type:complete
MKDMKTIRKNNKKLLSKIVKESAILGVYKGDGYYPISEASVLAIINDSTSQIRSAITEASGRLTIDLNDRSLGQYIIALPSLEHAKRTLYNKDYARLHPDNELALRRATT